MEHGTPPLRVFESRVSGVLDSEFHYRAILNFIWPFCAFGASFQTEDARHEYLPPTAFGARQTHLPNPLPWPLAPPIMIPPRLFLGVARVSLSASC
jgi:hypothetical protein